MSGSVRRWPAMMALLATFLACPVAGAAAPTTQAAMPSTEILPGQALGPVRLGMSVAEVTAVLGQPATGPQDTLQFPRWGISVVFQGGVAARASTTNPQYQTSAGARVGIQLDAVARLVRDFNEARTTSGSDVTIVYPFRGLGFVFRNGVAVQVFVVRAIILGPPPTQSASGGMVTALPPSASPPSGTPPQGAPSPQGGPALSTALKVRDLQETVDAANGILQVSGTITNTASQPMESVAVGVMFFKAGDTSAESTRAQVALRPIAPGGDAPFTVPISLGRAVVIRYTVDLTVAGTPPRVLGERTISPETYAELARARVRVDVQLGAPSNTSQRVQVLVSIAGTGPIPREWVRQVRVEIPYPGGSSTVTLAPGETQTILIPATAMGGMGQPRVQGVVLSAP